MSLHESSLSLIVIGIQADEICFTLSSLISASHRVREVIVVNSSPNLYESSHFASLVTSLKSLHVYDLPPSSIVHAFNYAISKCSSTHVCFINSGDSCIPDGFLSACDLLDSSNADLIASAVVVDHGASSSVFTGLDGRGRLRQVHQQGAIYRKSLHLEHGTYSSLFACAMDTAFFSSVLRVPGKYKVLFNSEPVARFYSGGVSTLRKSRTFFEYYSILFLSSGKPLWVLPRYLPNLYFKSLLSALGLLTVFRLFNKPRRSTIN